MQNISWTFVGGWVLSFDVFPWQLTLVLVVQVLQFILALCEAHLPYSNVQYLLDLLVTIVSLPLLILHLNSASPFFTSHNKVNKIIISSDCESAITTVSSFQYLSNFAKILCKIYDRNNSHTHPLTSKSCGLRPIQVYWK